MGLIASLLLVVGAAEAAARLLRPRAKLPAPAPVDARSYFSEQEIARGRRFTRPQGALMLGRDAVELGALALLWRHPPGRVPFERRPVVGGAATAAVLTVGLSLIALPLGAAARRRALEAGLATQPWRGWAVDQLKGLGIEAGLSAVAGAAVVAAGRRWPRGWWAAAAAGSVCLQALLTMLAPVLLFPVFNDFEPLPEGETRSDVLALAAAAGVRVGEVYVVDASRRTTAANAYVAGLGPTKRVVLFDTLLGSAAPASEDGGSEPTPGRPAEPFTRDQVRTVVAHELAHVRHRDVRRAVAFAALVAPAVGFAVCRLGPERVTPAALPRLALAAAAAGAPVGLAANRLSRAVERRADAFALELTHAPEAFIAFERQITLQNLGDPDPPRWAMALFSTHPSTVQRIGMAVGFAGPQTRAPARAPW